MPESQADSQEQKGRRGQGQGGAPTHLDHRQDPPLLGIRRLWAGAGLSAELQERSGVLVTQGRGRKEAVAGGNGEAEDLFLLVEMDDAPRTGGLVEGALESRQVELKFGRAVCLGLQGIGHCGGGEMLHALGRRFHDVDLALRGNPEGGLGGAGGKPGRGARAEESGLGFFGHADPDPLLNPGRRRD